MSFDVERVSCELIAALRPLLPRVQRSDRSLAVQLTRAGRAVLEHSARVRVRFAASFTPTDGPATRTTVGFTLD